MCFGVSEMVPTGVTHGEEYVEASSRTRALAGSEVCVASLHSCKELGAEKKKMHNLKGNFDGGTTMCVSFVPLNSAL